MVVAVCSTDADFDDVLTKTQGIKNYLYSNDIKKEFFIVKKFILDRHPLVDSMYKTVVFKYSHGLGEPANIMSWECTINDFLSRIIAVGFLTTPLLFILTQILCYLENKR